MKDKNLLVESLLVGVTKTLGAAIIFCLGGMTGAALQVRQQRNAERADPESAPSQQPGPAEPLTFQTTPDLSIPRDKAPTITIRHNTLTVSWPDGRDSVVVVLDDPHPDKETAK